MVGGHDVHGAVGQTLVQRLDVAGRAKWWVDLVDGVVAAHQVVGQQQVVGGDLGGDVDPPFLGAPDQIDTAGRGHVAHVEPGTDVSGQQDVTRDDGLLGHRGPAAQAQPRGHHALVHLGAHCQPGFLGVLGDDAIESLHVFQRAPHQQRIVDAFAVVAEHADPGRGVGHGPEFGQALPTESERDGAHREHIHVAGLLAQPKDLLDDPGGVRDGVSVGHGMHRGEAAEGRRGRAGAHGLGVLPTWFAQVRVQVHQPRQQHLAGQIEVAAGPVARGTDVLDDTVRHHNVDRIAAQRAYSSQDHAFTHAPTSWTNWLGLGWREPPTSR